MSIKVISWDIGIKNLSYCILEKERNEDYPIDKNGYSIIDWEVINLYDDEKNQNCCGLKKNKSVCGKTAKYTCNNLYYCKTHCSKDSKLIKKKKSKRNQFEYAIRIKEELDKRPELIDVTHVVIENQPALVNPIMKSVQMIIFSYFSFKRTNENNICVQNINAKQKEKLPDKDEKWEDSEYNKEYKKSIERTNSKYTRRKRKCFYYAKQCLETAPALQSFLDTHKKKDDLTDSYLMCVDFLQRNL